MRRHVFALACTVASVGCYSGSRAAQDINLAWRGHARAELEAKGIEFDGETIVTGVCRQAWFKDPDGNALMLHRRFDV